VYSSGDEALQKVHIRCNHVRHHDATNSMVYMNMAWSKDHGIACEAMSVDDCNFVKHPPRHVLLQD
jgi:hypothetical protein